MTHVRLLAVLSAIALLFALSAIGAAAEVSEVSDEEPAAVAPAAAETGEAADRGASSTTVGLQASTNFQEMLAGLKIQMGNIAWTPKFGFFVQSLKDRPGSVFNVGVGMGLDYYFQEGKTLRPYVGGDFLVYLPHTPERGTDLWFVISPHVGAEYWLSRSFSVGGNLGAQFGVGDAFYTPNTIGLVGTSDFSFGINGMLHVTYYF